MAEPDSKHRKIDFAQALMELDETQRAAAVAASSLQATPTADPAAGELPAQAAGSGGATGSADIIGRQREEKNKENDRLMLFMTMQQQQMSLHMQLMQEQMQAAPVVPPVVAPMLPAAEPVAMAASAAAVKAFGFEGKDADDPRVMSWGKAFDNPNTKKRSDPRDMAAINAVTAVFRKNVHLLMNSEIRVKKIGDDVAQIKEGKVPSGYKPFKLGLSTPWWDLKDSGASSTETIDFPENCTIGTAK